MFRFPAEDQRENVQITDKQYVVALNWVFSADEQGSMPSGWLVSPANS